MYCFTRSCTELFSPAERVVDGRGCSQPLAVDDLVVNVHRTQPTATLAVGKKVTIKEGETVQLPLRLTGEGVRIRRPSYRMRFALSLIGCFLPALDGSLST